MTDHPRSVQDIVQNYESRKQGLLRALSEDVEEFYQQCHPDRENMCLYGEIDGSWSVDLPAEEVPAELPEPCLGINFARDGMAKKDWLSLVAVHSDAWLLSVAFYYGAKLDSTGRDELFNFINRSPTLFEVVTGKSKGGMAPNKKARVDRGGNKRGRPLRNEDVSTSLRGKKAELFWPDDQSWYKVEIMQINPQQRTAKIQYDTGDFEDLELDEIIKDQQLLLLD